MVFHKLIQNIISGWFIVMKKHEKVNLKMTVTNPTYGDFQFHGIIEDRDL